MRKDATADGRGRNTVRGSGNCSCRLRGYYSYSLRLQQEDSCCEERRRCAWQNSQGRKGECRRAEAG